MLKYTITSQQFNILYILNKTIQFEKILHQLLTLHNFIFI